MRVFVSGATGYLGSALVRQLAERRHRVCALCRPGSESKVPPGCARLTGDALDAESIIPLMPKSDTYVHLVGVNRPAPWKASQFHAIDLTALRASVKAAACCGVSHFVFVSVARPAPVMQEYQAVRAVCEMLIADAKLNATILRPWYVLGPGHRWPHVLTPFYKLAETLPSMRDGALRLGMVTREQMTTALVWSVENPASGIRYLDVQSIRALSERPHADAGQTASLTGA